MFLLALALAPGIAIILFIYWKDTHEKEPLSLLFKAFLMGAFGSIILTLIISQILTSIYPIDEKSIYDQAISAYLQVGLVEEFSKFIFVLLFLYPHKEFDEPFDGIVYCVMVSMGFATLENIFYVLEGGVSVGILRMFTAVPAHATFGAIMGYQFGLAKFQHRKKWFLIWGLLGATIFHGSYDFFLFISFVPGIWVGALISLVVGAWLSIKAIRIHQGNSPFSSS